MRLAVASFAGVGALLCSSSALAAPPARTVVNFSAAPEGPKSEFSWLQHDQRPTLPPGVQRVVVTGRARRITDLTFNGRDHVLFVAPTRTGGYCTALTGPYGGSGCADHRPTLDPGITGDQSGPILFDGSFTTANATRVEVTYKDGSRSEMPFVWVSAPISAGFFVYQVPPIHRHPGDHPTLVSTYTSTGKLLAQKKIQTVIP